MVSKSESSSEILDRQTKTDTHGEKKLTEADMKVRKGNTQTGAKERQTKR